MTMPTIAVILPAYNEATRIEQTIRSIARYKAGAVCLRHVVIADDGSTDGTPGVIRRAAEREGIAVEVILLPHRGKALTVRDAMMDVAQRVDVDYLMMLDADDELKIDQLDRVIWSNDPRTIYIGRRVDSTDGQAGTTPTLVRRAMSLAMRSASRVMLGIRFPDTQCGFKLFPRHIVPELFGQQRSKGWTFDAELLFIAARVSGLPVQEVPVVWTPRGASRVRPISAALSALSMFGTAFGRMRGVYRPVGVDDSRSIRPSLVKR